MSLREIGSFIKQREHKLIMAASTWLLVFLITSCREQNSSPIINIPTPPLAETSVIIPEPSMIKEIHIPNVDRLLLGSSSVKDIADWLYWQPNTVRDDITMNMFGSQLETDVFNTDFNNESIYIHGRFGDTIGGKDPITGKIKGGGGLSWLMDFTGKRVGQYFQPTEIDNYWANEYREAENIDIARAAAKDMIAMVKMETKLFPKAQINIHLPIPVPWESRANKDAYYDELIKLLREERLRNPIDFGRVHLFRHDQVVMRNGRIDVTFFKPPLPTEKGPTHLKDPTVLFRSISEKKDVVQW